MWTARRKKIIMNITQKIYAIGINPEELNLNNVEVVPDLNSDLSGAEILFVFSEQNFNLNDTIKAALKAKEAGILTIGIAPRGIPLNFRKAVDAFILTDDLKSTVEFARAISSLLTSDGFVNLDLEDLKAFLSGAGKIKAAYSSASTPDRVERVTDEVLSKLDISEAKKILLSVTSGTNITLQEMYQATQKIENASNNSDDVLLIWGHVIDEKADEHFLSMALMAI